jgi:flagellar motility protein MotE (MotC chaperone)
MNNFRLLQLVVFACTCLLFLKSAAFIFDDSGSVITGSVSLNAQEAAKKDTAAAKEKTKTEENSKGPENKEGSKSAQNATDNKEKKVAQNQGPNQLKPDNVEETKVKSSSSELDLLESLAQRRKQLNKREADLGLKENLLKAAERQIDERIQQLKKLEARIQRKLKKQDVLNDEQYLRLVKIYTSMKPKEAARIFNGLKMQILVDLMRSMKAAASSQILAKMNPEKARELTLMLVKKDQMVAANDAVKTDELPSVQDDKPAEKNQ